MACHISPRTILIQCEKLKDLGGLFDTSGTKVTLGLKLRDVFGYFASEIHSYMSSAQFPWYYTITCFGALEIEVKPCAFPLMTPECLHKCIWVPIFIYNSYV
jgi:hypothetical protein